MSPNGGSRDAEPIYPVYLIQGSDPALVTQELSTLLAKLGHETGRPSRFGLEEHSLKPSEDTPSLAIVLDALRTPPFLADGRLIVARDAEALDAAGAREIASYLSEPTPSNVLVLVATGKGLPTTLSKVIGATGLVIGADPGSGTKARTAWLAGHVSASAMRLEPAALAMLAEHLGEDLSRVEGILSQLLGAYGEHARIGPKELEPFLGAEGGLAPWDLTDAIDKGDIATALHVLARLLSSGRHPLQVLASLERHYQAMLRLDGLEGIDATAAAAVTKMAPYPAGKVLRQGRALGHDRVARAIQLLASADLDLRGMTGLPGEVVIEVLVARLAQLPKIKVQSGPLGQGARPFALTRSKTRTSG